MSRAVLGVTPGGGAHARRPSDVFNSNGHTANDGAADGFARAYAAEDWLYNLRRSGCETSVELRRATAIVGERLQIEEAHRARESAQLIASLDAASVLSRGLQKAAAVLLREEQRLGLQLVASTSGGGGNRYAVGMNASSNGAAAVLPPPSAMRGARVHQHADANVTPGRSQSLHSPRIGDSDAMYRGPHGSNYDAGGAAVVDDRWWQPPGAVPTEDTDLYESELEQSYPTLVSAMAVLKDILLGSLDVLRDLHGSVEKSRRGQEALYLGFVPPASGDSGIGVASPTSSGAAVDRRIAVQRLLTGADAATLNALSGPGAAGVAAGGSVQQMLEANGPMDAAFPLGHSRCCVETAQRVRRVERAVAAQALQELKAEVTAHQRTRMALQKKLAALALEYEQLVVSVADLNATSGLNVNNTSVTA
jgi:hypothetical protein